VNGYLLDENLPYRLRFQPSQPIHHSSDVSGHPSDAELWDYAKANSLVIVTKDADFSDRILVSEPPAMGSTFAFWQPSPS
jgi:predicted nuclease of predicted toxin-antitoxin system